MHTRFHAFDGHTATHNESPSNTSFNMLLVEKRKKKPSHHTNLPHCGDGARLWVDRTSVCVVS